MTGTPNGTTASPPRHRHNSGGRSHQRVINLQAQASPPARWPAPGSPARVPRTGSGTPRRAGCSQPAAGSPRPGSCYATPAPRRPLSTPGPTSPRFGPSPGPGRGRHDEHRPARSGPRLPVRAPRPGLPPRGPRAAARSVPGRPGGPRGHPHHRRRSARLRDRQAPDAALLAGQAPCGRAGVRLVPARYRPCGR